MTQQNTTSSQNKGKSSRIDRKRSIIGAGYYEIKVQGYIDEEWVNWFSNIRVSYDADGFSILSGYMVDQSALHGILAQIRDLALPLVSLNRQELGAEKHK
jgi:hypothetical protein